MPYVPDASMMTRVRKATATVNTDPVKKSRTFVAPTKGGYLPAQLAIPVWESPQAGRKLFLK